MRKSNLGWLSAGLLVVALAILACGGGSTPTPSSTVSGTVTAPPAAKRYKVGDQVKVGSTLVITINSVTTSQGDDISAPKSGNTFLVVDMTIKNVSADKQTISELDFTVKDTTGQQYNPTILDNGTPAEGDVGTGEQIRGQDGFEVPQAQKQFVLQYSTFSGDLVEWDISVS